MECPLNKETQLGVELPILSDPRPRKTTEETRLQHVCLMIIDSARAQSPIIEAIVEEVFADVMNLEDALNPHARKNFVQDHVKAQNLIDKLNALTEVYEVHPEIEHRIKEGLLPMVPGWRFAE